MQSSWAFQVNDCTSFEEGGEVHVDAVDITANLLSTASTVSTSL